MLDLKTLETLRLSPRPPLQVAAAPLVRLNYRLSGVNVALEGLEHLPKDEPIFLAMNHTDRFNYIPFQSALHNEGGYPFIATWAKGKYFNNPILGWMLRKSGNIPVPSRGYLFSRDFLDTLGRPPTEADYKAIQTWKAAPHQSEPPDEDSPLRRLWTEKRVILGRLFDPKADDALSYPRFMDKLFDDMMALFVDINAAALFDHRLLVQVFPQGTRSIRLSRGHTGIIQLAMHLNVPILPIGCNGTDRLYPGNSPWARGGRAVYRIGAPLRWDGALAPYRIADPFKPFTHETSRRHGQRFQEAVDYLMDQINRLLDEPYRYSLDRSSDGVQGSRRFL